MRAILHAVVLAVVLFAAVVCTMVQLADLDAAVGRLQRDDVAQQVGTSTR